MKKQISSNLYAELPEISLHQAQLVVKHLVYIKDIEKDQEVDGASLMRVNPEDETAVSVKLSNIRLDIKLMLGDIPDLMLKWIELLENPELLPLAVLKTWDLVYSHCRIELDTEHAIAIMLMWQHSEIENIVFQEDKAYTIKEAKAFGVVNDYLKGKKRNQLSKTDFGKVLKDLEKMKCIKKIDDKRWWMTEEVKFVTSH